MKNEDDTVFKSWLSAIIFPQQNMTASYLSKNFLMVGTIFLLVLKIYFFNLGTDCFLQIVSMGSIQYTFTYDILCIKCYARHFHRWKRFAGVTLEHNSLWTLGFSVVKRENIFPRIFIVVHAYILYLCSISWGATMPVEEILYKHMKR